MRAAPAAAAPQGGGTGLPIDPVRLLRQYKYVLVLSVVMGIGLGVGAYMVLRRTSPRFTSTMYYEVLPNETSIESGSRALENSIEFERVARTELRQMTSETVLKLGLRQSSVAQTKWVQQHLVNGVLDETRAFNDLRGAVTAAIETGTALLRLSASSSNAEDARQLANAVHTAYFDDLRSRLRDASTEDLEALNQSLAQNVTTQRQIRSLVEKLQTEKEIETDDSRVGTARETADAATRSLGELRNEIKAFEARQTRLSDIASKGDLAQVPADIAEGVRRTDPKLIDQERTLLLLETEKLSLLDRGYGANHPEMRQIEARIGAARVQSEKVREEAMRAALSAEIEDLAGRLTGMKGQEENLTATLKVAQDRLVEIKNAQTQLEDLRDQQDSLKESEKTIIDRIRQIEQLTVRSTGGRLGRIRVAQLPNLPTSVTFPQLPMLAILGVVLCGGLTGGLVVLRELLDQRVRGPSDLSAMARLRVIGQVPSVEEDPTKPEAVETAFRDAPTGAVSEGFRQLRAVVAKKMALGGHRTLLVVSAMPGSGATSTVCNLGMGFAASDFRVLMIDANFRRPTLHRVFKLGEGPGLGELLSRKVAFEAAVQQTPHTNLHLISAGLPASRGLPERLATEAMSQALRESAERYDLVLIDTAPMQVAGDGLALANRVDASLLVIRAMLEKRGMVARFGGQLGETRAELLGVVINGVRFAAGGYLRKNIRASFEYQQPTA
ncbi:MAG: hypothetical protein C0475_06045 [Planctomyces sp.]|nr:hypothetical protein [Planctomyces sp.]